MNDSKDRREFIRLMLLAGFGACLPACVHVATDEKKEKQIPKATSSKELLKDTIAEIEEKTKSGNVIYFKKEDEEFENLSLDYNLAVPKQPAMIALCKNTAGVAEAVQYAINNDLKVAVKSGGHSFENFSSINGGLQINLSLLNSIEWEGEHVKLGPACLLKDIYDAVLPKKRLLPAGSCGTVGIGGLTLGGGYGFFSRKYGLTCDHLVAATMVDGQGKIHELKEGDELMWGLKGGGNGNFGVVTEMKFTTRKAPTSFTRHRFKAYKLDKDRTKELLQAYFQYSAQLPETCFAAFVLNYKTMVLLITNYGKASVALDEMLEKFKEISDDTSIGSPRDLAKSLRNYYGVDHPIPFKNASAGYYQDYETIAPFIDEVLDLVFRKRGLIYQINTLGRAIDSAEFKANSSYPHREMPYLSELQTYWEDYQDPTQLLSTFDEIQEVIYNAGVRKQYRNYPNIRFKDWESSYYGDNYMQLQALKRQYDPDDLFTHAQTVKL